MNSLLQKKNSLDLAMIVVVLVLALATFYQPLRWMMSAWWSDPYYSHGFLVPFISIGMIWLARDQLRKLPARTVPLGLGLVALALALTTWSLFQQAYFAASVMLILFAIGLGLYLLGWAVTKLLLFPIIYLVLMIPLPFVNDWAMQLQLWTSGLSAAGARLLGVPVLQQGASVSIPGASYVVGLACSGLNSIIALLAIGVLIAYLVSGPLWARLVIIASIVPIAVLANTMRISSLLWVANSFGDEAGLTYHDTIAGFLSWGVALALLILITRLLRCRLNLDV